LLVAAIGIIVKNSKPKTDALEAIKEHFWDPETIHDTTIYSSLSLNPFNHFCIYWGSKFPIALFMASNTAYCRMHASNTHTS